MRRPAKYFGKKFEMGVVANRLISVWGDVPDSGHALAKNMEHFFGFSAWVKFRNRVVRSQKIF